MSVIAAFLPSLMFVVITLTFVVTIGTHRTMSRVSRTQISVSETHRTAADRMRQSAIMQTDALITLIKTQGKPLMLPDDVPDEMVKAFESGFEACPPDGDESQLDVCCTRRGIAAVFNLVRMIQEDSA